MLNNSKPPQVVAITDALEVGTKVSELLAAGDIRAIIIDMRQAVLVVHFEDGSPKAVHINGESIPYLLGAVKIISLPGTFPISEAQKELINYAKKSNLDPKTYISTDFVAENLDDTALSVITSSVIIGHVLLLVMGPISLESLSQCTIVAAHLE